MKKIRKSWWLIPAFACLTIIFAFTRLYHLTTWLPIFTDESIYIRWSEIALNDASWRFISLTDGKQPMYVWIALVLLKFIHDPLEAGRLVSVFAGFFSMIGLFFLGREIFKNAKIGILSSLLYVLYPFALVYDKLALYDSLVATFLIWIFYFTILLVRHVRLDIAMFLGMITGFGMLTKSNDDFGLILLPFSLLLFPFKIHFDKRRLYMWALYAFVAVIIANTMYEILRLSPFYYIIGQKNLTFIYSFHDWIREPFAFFFGNLKSLFAWFVGYMTIPFVVVAAAAFFVDKKFLKEKILLFLWFVLPFLALAFFGKVIYPRFILNMTMSIIILGAYSLYTLSQYVKQLWLKFLIFIVFTSMFFVTDFYILTDFPKAPIPLGDMSQFYNGWASGVGVNQTVQFLQQKAQGGKIYVGTEGTFGLMPYALQVYLWKNPNINIQGFWPINSAPPQEIIDASKKEPTYVIFYESCPSCQAVGIAPSTWSMTEIFSLKKVDPDTYYTLYKFNSQ
jgi:4-amino-4-deoxy-L-arabinose transferase-like glycosyltransferase